MADLLTKSAREIRGRLAELEPAVIEHRRLTEALRALEGVLDKGRATAKTRRSSGRRPNAPRQPGARRRPPGRRRQTRAQRFVALVERQPGITVADAAKRLRTTPASLYQVTSRLQKEGRVRKQGRGFHPAS